MKPMNPPSANNLIVSADLFNIVAQGEWVLQGDELRLTQQPELRTTSLAVATVFGKNHRDVLRAIRNMECSEEFRRENFKEYGVEGTAEISADSSKNLLKIEGVPCLAPDNQSKIGLMGLRKIAQTPYLDSQGKPQPMVEMTRKGFEFLVLGFTGRKAAQFREAYVERFHQMEAELVKKTNEIKSLSRRYEHLPFINGVNLTARTAKPYRIKNPDFIPIPGVSIRQTARGDGDYAV